MEIQKIFDKPKILGVVSDVNEGKSMLLYHLIETAKREFEFSIFYYGLRKDIQLNNAIRIFSITELEKIRNSIIIVDELSSLFDLDNRKSKRQIENSLRLINHNNNILVLSGTPENFKKFISAKVDQIFFKRTTISDFINGSKIKNIVNQYKGYERGSEILNLPVNEALFYDGEHYHKFPVNYFPQYDTKKDNVSILQKCAKNVPKNVQKIKGDEL